ncbi:MAG: hypothetical protein O2877_01995, partial [bacterium]|nr:hypothetical protein [bacterium]
VWKTHSRIFTTVVFEGDWFMVANPVHDGYFFGKQTNVPATEPYPNKLFFLGKQFEMLRSESATLSELYGDGPFDEGVEVKMEVYKTEDGSVLRLQRYGADGTYDVVGKEVPLSWIKIQG